MARMAWLSRRTGASSRGRGVVGSSGSTPGRRQIASPATLWIEASRKCAALSWRSTKRAFAEQRTHSASNRMIGPSAIAKQGVLIDEFAEARVGDPEVDGETAGAQDRKSVV